MNREPIVLILASGVGARFQSSGGVGSKLDAPLLGKTVLAHTIAAAADSGLPWRVVSGIEGGMGATIAAGVRASAHAPGWLILPGDLPLIAAASIRSVASQLREHLAVVPHWEGRKGHPVAFRHECLASLARLGGATGAAPVVQELRSRGAVLDLSLADRGIVMDIDTVHDLALAAQALAAR